MKDSVRAAVHTLMEEAGFGVCSAYAVEGTDAMDRPKMVKALFFAVDHPTLAMAAMELLVTDGESEAS